MNGETLSVALVVAQQEHSPAAGAHAVLLVGAVVAVLVLFGVKWWRGRRDATATDEHSDMCDRSAESTRSTEEE
jgi:hypothetical protein